MAKSSLGSFEEGGGGVNVYSKKLSKPQWQKKRLECFERAGWKCQRCGSTSRSLHLHHPQYDGTFEKQPWEYDDLEVLCSKCHKQEHFHPVEKLIYGEFYTVTHGSMRGDTAVAWSGFVEMMGRYDGSTLYSPDWSFGEVSFFKSLHKVRMATKGEELKWRRKHGTPPTEQ